MINLQTKNLFLGALLLTLAALNASDKGSLTASSAPYNNYVLAAIDAMPLGGGYSVDPRSIVPFEAAVTIKKEKLEVNPQKLEPSFCSAATYLVFLKTLLLLQEQQKVALPLPVLQALLPDHLADGVGLWGRWNANGPGVARLFCSLKLGPNFSNLEAAQPGDFLKFFWNDEIGVKEHGHLVVFLGAEKKEGTTIITYWSSNKSTHGYGKKTVPLSRLHHLLFSRLNAPQNILNASSLPQTDFYLASLLKRSSSWEEVKACCHLTN